MSGSIPGVFACQNGKRVMATPSPSHIVVLNAFLIPFLCAFPSRALSILPFRPLVSWLDMRDPDLYQTTYKTPTTSLQLEVFNH